jgi:tRNA-Thr(GGU) m(6)t(6)A37 methyltransferase TsaA
MTAFGPSANVGFVLARVRRLLQRPREDAPYLPSVTVEPIGVVRNSIPVPQAYDFDWRKVESRIIVRAELTDALLDLDGYSHILVLFWPHLVPGDVRGSKPQLHPLDDERNPLQGILATRSQIRFNPVLVTAARLLAVKRNVVRVSGLDAVDGSPVIDIKPYIAYFDSVQEATIPEWLVTAAERRAGIE